MKSGNQEYSEAYFERAKKKELSFSFGVGLIDNEGKIQDYDKALEYDNHELAKIYMARGITKLDITKISTKDIEEAIKDFDRAIEIDPILAEAHFQLGIAKSKLKDNQSAIESFDRAIEIDPTLAKAYFKRAIAQHSLNPEKAVKDYSEVLKFNYNSFTARHQRTRLYCELKEYLKAIEDYDYIIENHDNLMMFDPIYEDLMTTDTFYHLHNFYINRGKAKFHLNDYQAAIKDFTHILEELHCDDSDASYYCELAKSRLAS